MARRLIVHIGMPRAGSSTLQEVLFHYRDRLEPQGLLYPVLSLGDAGTTDRAQIYNHKLLHQAARAIWPPGRFNRLHEPIATRIAGSAAPMALLSYEGWWHPANIPALRKTVAHIGRACPGIETSIAAIVREPAAFMLSLYKLDVLHGRTGAVFDDYWPAKLGDPRLRYGRIAAALTSAFPRLVMLEFDTLSRDGRLVANALTAFGAPDILKRAGIATLEDHRSKGGDFFADPAVSMTLFAARHLGLRQFRRRRSQIRDMVMQLATRPDLSPACRDLAIPLGPGACKAIVEATRAETAAFQRITGLRLPAARPKGNDGEQSVIADDSPLGSALRAALRAMR